MSEPSDNIEPQDSPAGDSPPDGAGLSQSEIDALLNQDQSGAGGGAMSQAEIDALTGGGQQQEQADASQSERKIEIANDSSGEEVSIEYEVVSQAEIDALLSAYQSVNATSRRTAAEKNREVRLYDFTKPDRFSKEHLRALSSIHSRFATALTSALPAVYHVPTCVDFIGIDQLSYKEYRESVPQKTLLAEVLDESLNSGLLFEANPTVVGAWVDYICGGNPEIPAEPSELSPGDLAMARMVLRLCAQVYADSWNGIVELQPKIGRVVDSESYDQMLLPTEPVVVCSFEVRIAMTVGMMTICLPAASVELLLPALATMHSHPSSRREDKSVVEGLEKALEQVDLPCKVILGRSTVVVSDALSLDVGDVIKTSRRADSDMEMWVGNKPMFACRPGVRGKTLAVLVSGDDPSTIKTEADNALEDSMENSILVQEESAVKQAA